MRRAQSRLRRAPVLELIIISTLNGVLFGMLLFLMASGLTLIFSMMGVINFAHASFYMLGAFFGFQISQWVGFWPALLVAPLMVGGIGRAQPYCPGMMAVLMSPLRFIMCRSTCCKRESGACPVM